MVQVSAGLGPADAHALKSIGIDLDAVVSQVDAAFGAGALDRKREPARRHLPFDKAAKKALRQSMKEAVALRDRDIGVAHVLLGVLAQDDSTVRTLLPAGVTVARARGAISPLTT